MPKKIYLFLIALLFQFNAVFSQSKIVLDKNSGGGYCNNYFDLGDQGFALIFNKNKDDESVGSNATLQNNVFYYSKDLSKKANFKISSNGIFTINATKNHLILLDRLSSKYHVRVLDFMGREVSSRKFDLNTIGLNQEVISKIHYTDQGKMIFEVYDGHDDLHIYTINLIETRGGELTEVDIPLPSANPLESMTFSGHWKMVAQNMGYYILVRKGANSEFDPNAIAYHIAFYDEDFSLFREFLLDNFLMPNVQMIGKEASFILNPTLQSFAVSCLIMRNGKLGFMVANYGMNSNSNVMSLFWHKEFEITQNGKYRLIENDGLSVPAPPIISNKGPKIIVNVVKNRMNVSEEAINQMVVFDAQGNAVFNEIQMGNFEGLNLDNYCVDNDNLYSRIKKLQIATVLKPYCEQVNTDVLDIDVDAEGNELAIVRNYDITKNQVIIYRFNHK